MIDRAEASEKTVPRDLGGALGALPRAAKRRKVDLREHPGNLSELVFEAGRATSY